MQRSGINFVRAAASAQSAHGGLPDNRRNASVGASVGKRGYVHKLRRAEEINFARRVQPFRKLD
jgi:hypothetical protein